MMLLLAMPQNGGDELFELKGYRLGIRSVDFLATFGKGVFPPQCFDHESGSQPYPDQFKMGIVHCYRRLTVANIEPEILAFSFVDGQMYSISAKFSESQFDTVRDALITKYGNPTGEQSSVVQNSFGALFINRTLSWERPSSYVMLLRYSTDLKTSALSFVHRELEKKVEKLKPKARPDL